MPVAGVGVGIGVISLGPADPVALTGKDKGEQELGRLSPGIYDLGKASLSP